MTYQATSTLETVRAQWELAADGWDAQSPALSAWLAGPTQTMLDFAGVEPGAHVLDLAAGAGDQTLALAGRVGGTGGACRRHRSVAGADRTPPRERRARRGSGRSRRAPPTRRRRCRKRTSSMPPSAGWASC